MHEAILGAYLQCRREGENEKTPGYSHFMNSHTDEFAQAQSRDQEKGTDSEIEQENSVFND